jgi:GrpB-like predicted nucleotidyltransferase (UPF0157 family)
MMARPDEAVRYAELKRSLAAQFRSDVGSYCDGKDAYIEATEIKAAAWSKRRKR